MTKLDITGMTIIGISTLIQVAVTLESFSRLLMQAKQ